MRKNQMKRAFLTLAILTVALVWCVFAHAQSLGPITTPQMNKAYFFVGTSPYLTTIQSAVTAACATGKGSVVVPPGVTPSDAPGAVTGCTAVGLVVQTTLPWHCFASTGGVYSTTDCTPSSGPGGTVTSVSSGNLSPLFTVTVQNGSTTPNFVFSLSNAGQNAFLGGPASGGSGAPSYRALMVADLPTGIPNANLLNPSTTVNGQTCTLGGSCTIPEGGTPLTCNSNGCWREGADGTIEQWGTTAAFGSGSPITVDLTFPTPFTTIANVVVIPSLTAFCTTGSDSGTTVVAVRTSLTTTGVQLEAEVDTSVCPSGSYAAQWMATGN
jgi:hypothetical protein